MTSFADAEGRRWQLRIDVSALRRVRAATELNLAALDEQLLVRLASDPVLLADVLWSLVSEQARAAGVGDEAFGRALRGDAIAEATEALLGEIVDFFPSRRRGLLQKARAKQAALEESGLAALEAYLDGPAVEKEMAERLARILPEGPSGSGG